MHKLEKVKEALELSATTFRKYEKLHNAKNTSDATAKAESNAEIAATVEEALAALTEFMEKFNRRVVKAEDIDMDALLSAKPGDVIRVESNHERLLNHEMLLAALEKCAENEEAMGVFGPARYAIKVIKGGGDE